MNPDYLKGMSYYAMLSSVIGGLLRPAKTKQQRLLERLDEAERIAIKRANSPEVAAAEAKRLRKQEKLRKLEK